MNADLLRSEWIKLRTVRSHVVLVVLAIALPAVPTVLTALLAGTETLEGGLLASISLNTLVLSQALLGSLGVLVIAQELGFGTIRVTFAVAPRRTRVLVAKGLVLAIACFVVTTLAIALSFGLGAVLASTRGVTVQVSADRIAAGLIVPTVFALLAMGVAMLVRNTAGAIVLSLVWMFVLEALLALVLGLVIDDLLDFAPVSTGIAAISAESASDLRFGRWGSIAYFGAWTVGALCLGAAVTARRDA